MTQLMDRALCTTAPTFVSDSDPADVSQIAARVGFTLPVFIAPKLQDVIYTVPQGYWHETTDGRLIEVLQAALTTIALTPTEDPYVDIRFTARMAHQADESATVHLTIKLIASYDLAPWREELSITLSLASPGTPPPQTTASIAKITPLDQAVRAYGDRPSKEDSHLYIPLWAAPLVPALYAQDGLGAEAVVYLKYFTPDSSWTWYCTEMDQETGMCFGLVDGFEIELGYFSLGEITAARGKLGLRIERDLWFCPRTIGELRESL